MARTMKLFICTQCFDVRRLHQHRTHCRCRKAWAKYKDEREHEAITNSYSLIIGIDATALNEALERKVGMMSGSQKLEAFLLPEPCSTVERVGRLAQ